MTHNENSRVKIPAILHLGRLGYQYLSLSNSNWDKKTNIFTDIFMSSFFRMNPEATDSDFKKTLEDIQLMLDYEDLGKAFYERLTAQTGFRIIDFDNFDNNSFQVVTELECVQDDENFRPDITTLINGLPLAFVEVKKPNNRDGIMAERDRINVRFKNRKFRRFINVSQLLVFSNNMEYDNESIVPIMGAFYATTGRNEAVFHCFREEEKLDLDKLLLPENEETENFILKDQHLQAAKHSPELITNKDPNTPTNRILTSLFCRERLFFLLKYGIAYVKETSGLEKHIMRYPQIFASRAIAQKLENGIRKGIVWHTQGSGKTALAYYCTHFLTDFYQKKGIIPKFYFIVDRIDLATQAKGEFESRGLKVHIVHSKEDLLNDFRKKQVIHGLSGEREITVVNIHKFKNEDNVVRANDYHLSTQRVYFLDEVHRSYNPTGSFLANLFNSDREAILIGLTGTPLITTDRKTRDIFGDYFHKYYYNASISDGYTLKLIREGIETKYKMQLEAALREVEVLKGDADKRQIYAHEKFVEPMLDYIVGDFESSKAKYGDPTIGAMVVCDSSEQAKMLFKIFQEKFAAPKLEIASITHLSMAAEPEVIYGNAKNRRTLSAALILHDVQDKDYRKEAVRDFKDGKIDILFVYQMLLTGFDAKRLKKMYLGRIVKDHNLLQTLTRVNRPYKNHRYGYVVDFADIRKEFDATNKAYFEELQQELGDEIQSYSSLFKSAEEIEQEIKQINDCIWRFDTMNREEFSNQISQITDKKQLLVVKKALQNARELFNIIRLQGNFELLEKLDFRTLGDLLKMTSDRLDLLHFNDSIQNDTDSTYLLNAALDKVFFLFRKISEHELVIADKLREQLRKTREALHVNFDQGDPAWVNLYEELKRLFKEKKLDEVTQEEMTQNIGALRSLCEKAAELNRQNNLLRSKYAGDEKWTRIHKKVQRERPSVTKNERELFETFSKIKAQADEKVLINHRILENEPFFGQMMQQLVIQGFEKNIPSLNADGAKFINLCVVNEYTQNFRSGTNAW